MDASLRVRALRARCRIASGDLRGEELSELLLSVPAERRDDWINAVLGIDGPPPPDQPDLPRASVPYLPCGIEEILAMVRDVPLKEEDELVDLGCGLGRVVILAHLLSGARARGIEIQGHLVRAGRALTSELALPAVSFVHANVADVEIDGSVFFLYAPFNGETLRRSLQRLRSLAERKPIVVCAVGIEFRDEGWLLPRSTSSVALTIYGSRRWGGGPRLP